ncbi:helix-turn-helix transcriptional regulator [Propionimicrobium sp. PCR01-08-3]|uniref:helix-turn-helix transcriptional regulator n=1 Tax=Propionimicrobium sp. PCR01-08-3 TaxID=3052086 RepID=UPI00255C439A|nr:helix-turn-helix transcriptional regulator [Propionimicrobium sp. PCR01-08-3]WIY84052.1 helix-turn-helix transcriptional regulator [Propionimicrobium sp. PCR01-08-3]
METQPFIDTVDRLADVVREARTRQGWTQAELAQEAGVGRRFVVDLEKGHARAELEKTLDVLRVLGLRPRAIPAYQPWAYGTDGRLKEDTHG